MSFFSDAGNCGQRAFSARRLLAMPVLAAVLLVAPAADAKLYHHVTSGEKAKFPDGHEEEHKIIQTTDTDAIKNLIDWILSL